VVKYDYFGFIEGESGTVTSKTPPTCVPSSFQKQSVYEGSIGCILSHDNGRDPPGLRIGIRASISYETIFKFPNRDKMKKSRKIESISKEPYQMPPLMYIHVCIMPPLM